MSATCSYSCPLLLATTNRNHTQQFYKGKRSTVRFTTNSKQQALGSGGLSQEGNFH